MGLLLLPKGALLNPREPQGPLVWGQGGLVAQGNTLMCHAQPGHGDSSHVCPSTHTWNCSDCMDRHLIVLPEYKCVPAPPAVPTSTRKMFYWYAHRTCEHTHSRMMCLTACVHTCVCANLPKPPATCGSNHPRGAADSALPLSLKRMEPPELWDCPWKQGPGTRTGFWSPVTAVARGVTAPSSANPQELRQS